MKIQQPEFKRVDDKPVYRLEPDGYYVDTYNPDKGQRAEIALIRPTFILNEVFTPVLGGKLMTSGLYVSPFASCHFFKVSEFEYRMLAHARLAILAQQYGVADLVQYPRLAKQVLARMEELIESLQP